MYNIPNVLNESIEILKNIVDFKDDIALLNALNSKVANMVSIKGCKFKQYSNSFPRTLSYYCMSFIPSGYGKDYAVDCINMYLLNFIPKELEEKVADYKIEYEETQRLTRVGKKAEKQIEDELDKIRTANFEIANINYTGIYKEAEQVDRMNYGALYIRMGELGDFLDLISSGDRSKKEVYQKLKDIYEGTFYPSIIASDSKRKALYNIPVQIYLYTDFENLFKPHVKEFYLNSLKTGMARRSFIFIPSDGDFGVPYPARPEAKEQNIEITKKLREKYKNIFHNIKENTVYELSTDAKNLIYDYQCRCVDYFNNSKDNTVIKMEKKESFWKITKLAVVYSIIDNPKSTIVSSEYVQMAIDFYNLISPCLKNVIEKRKKSEIELYAEYINDNKDEIITRTALRNLNLVNGNKFKKFWEEHEEEVKEELENTYNLMLYPYEGKGNLKSYQVVKK